MLMSPCFSLIVLLLIRKGLVRVLAQLRRLVRIVADAQPAQGQDIRRDKEYLRSVHCLHSTHNYNCKKGSFKLNDANCMMPPSYDCHFLCSAPNPTEDRTSIRSSKYFLLTGPPHPRYSSGSPEGRHSVLLQEGERGHRGQDLHLRLR